MALFETWLKSDLKKPLKVEQLKGNLFSSDNGGNQIGVEVFDDGSPATLTGGVMGYVIRADGATVAINGSSSGNRAYIVLPASAYIVAGQVSIAIKVGTTTVCACTGYVYRTTTDALVDPGHVIPSIEELLAKIADCEAATTAAESAAEDANDAASSANTAASAANTAAGSANTAAGSANSAAGSANTAATAANTAAQKIDGLTVEASQLTPGSAPTAVVSEVSGHKHVAFGIPKGDTGVTPDITIGDVETLLPGEDAYVELDETSTPEEPVLNIGIPKGDPGSITNAFATNIPMSPTDPTTIKEAMDDKLENNQGSGNAGKYMKVGLDGSLTPEELQMDAKADKVTGATSGNFAGLDANGNLTDSGKKASDFLTAQDITGKVDKNQGTENAGKALGINAQGMVEPVPFSGDDFTGATSSTAGVHGYVPAPSAGDQDKVLMGDGTWSDDIPERLAVVENVCTETPVTIAVSDWSGTPYSYTWTSSLVTSGSEIEVFLRDGAENAGIEEFNFEKVTGGVQFTTNVLPTGSLPVTIRVINAQADAFQTLTGEDIGTDVISGADNVDEALGVLQNANVLNAYGAGNYTPTTTLVRCSGTIDESPRIHISGNAAIIDGRVRISNYVRNDPNPGFKVTLPNGRKAKNTGTFHSAGISGTTNSAEVVRGGEILRMYTIEGSGDIQFDTTETYTNMTNANKAYFVLFPVAIELQ